MRALALACVVLTSAAWSTESRRQQVTEERSLTREEIEHRAAAYLPAIRACYVTKTAGARAATGMLTLRMRVLRNGAVTELAVEAPGVTGARLRALVDCITDEVEGWQFPIRHDDTLAVLPYHFHRVYAPGAGPQYSCWNPRGCFGRSDKPENRR